MTASSILASLRNNGWHVAIHNDYRLGNAPWRTFWLLTHQRGVFVKGEGDSDLEALQQCWKAALDMDISK